MRTKMNLEGSTRKALVSAIAEITGEKVVYRVMPTSNYDIGEITVTRDGSIICPDDSDIITALAAVGFTAEDDQSAELAEEPTGLTISLPRDGFNDSAIGNLKKLVDAKGALIRKALNSEQLDIIIEDDKISFPWWDTLPQPDEVHTYTGFIAALCKMAKEARRVLAKETVVESEKYAFRCFLLRLGYIGEDSKADRRILLHNLSGHAAFRNQAEEDKFKANQKAKRDAAKTTAQANENELDGASEEAAVCE